MKEERCFFASFSSKSSPKSRCLLATVDMDYQHIPTYCVCVRDSCPIWATKQNTQKILKLLMLNRNGLEDLNGYNQKELIQVGEEIFEDPDGRRYRREDCSSEAYAQGSRICNCEGIGYRYRPIDK